MHTPKAFALTNLKQQQQLVEEYPLATIIKSSDKSSTKQANTIFDAQHVPLYWHSDNHQPHCLYGHVARNNPLVARGLKSDVLCIFQGPQAYISPRWYPTKQQHGKAVPTWNYVAVHIHGTLSIIEEAHKTIEVIEGLSNKMEAETEAKLQQRWQLSDAPKEYIEKMLQGIVGIEITIESIEGQCKLSQNQPAINIDGVVNGLGESTQPMAKLMSKQMAQAIANKKYQ